MKMNTLTHVGALAALILAGLQSTATFAEETTSEKVGTTMNKAGDNINETVRDAEDKACPMVNGKLDCKKKKIKHKVQTAIDKTKTKAKEVKNKVD